MNERFEKQMDFLIEIDKVKQIIRKTNLFDSSRKENDAEHSWHLAMMTLALAEHANEKIDIEKVLKMVLIHDIVEIDGGDFIVYDNTAAAEKDKREQECAQRVYGLLPDDMKNDFITLWVEFEKRATPEAKFAAGIDRAEPIIQNYYNKGGTWKEHNVPYELVIKVNRQKIKEASQSLWEYIDTLLNECLASGYIKKESDM